MKKTIAVIGSGIAGLTAGWLCRESGANVTIFEANSKRGMDCHTLYLDQQDKSSGYVDIPLRVMSPHAWPTTLKMCEIPIRYKARMYGSTQISRFSHGLMLIKMVIFAFFRIKAI